MMTIYASAGSIEYIMRRECLVFKRGMLLVRKGVNVNNLQRIQNKIVEQVFKMIYF